MRTAIYCRISQDDEGTALGVKRQREDCEAEAERRGWTVVEVYTDNDVSATKAKVRPAYQRMFADARAGQFDAILVYAIDRLTRKPRELEDVIDLANDHGVTLANVSGSVNLSTPEGQAMARMLGANARLEVENMSRRIRRKSDERAADGKPHGRVGYGYVRVDGVDVEEPEAAAVVRELARRVLDGESLRSLASELNRRGIAGPNAATWSGTSVRLLLARPNLAGLRRHRGVVIGRTNGTGIITEDEHARLLALFNDPARLSKGSGGRAPVHLMSGLAECGACGAKMLRIPGFTPPEGSKSKATKPAYHCRECFKIRRLQAPVDAIVTEAVIRRLEKPDAAALFDRGDDLAAAEAREALAAIDAKLANAADMFAADSITGEQLRRITEVERGKREGHERVLAAALPRGVPAGIVGERARERWEELTLEQRRTVVDILLVLVILPLGRSVNSFSSESVRIDWR